MVAVHRCGQLYIHMNCRRCTASCLGAHSRKNGVDIYNAREYGIYTVMKKFLLHYNLHVGSSCWKVD